MWDKFDFKAVSLFSPNLERARTIYHEFDRVGLTGVTPMWSAPNPYEWIAESHASRQRRCSGGNFSVTVKHQQMVRTAYDTGAEFGLFFEDDIRFLKDTDALEGIVSSIPDDTDFCLFDWKLVNSFIQNNFPDMKSQAESGARWVRFKAPVVQASCYALRRPAMRTFLGFLENPARGKGKLDVCDRYWYPMVQKGLIGYVSMPIAATQVMPGGHVSFDAAWNGYLRHGIRREDYAE